MKALLHIAEQIVKDKAAIIEANEKDLKTVAKKDWMKAFSIELC